MKFRFEDKPTIGICGATLQTKSIAVASLLSVFMLVNPQPVRADVILNTITGPFSTGGVDVSNTASPLPNAIIQSIALRFSSASSETITQIKAYISLVP